MSKIYNYEGKTEQEALTKCLEDLNVEQTELFCSKKETEAKLFKSKKVELIVLKKEDVVKDIKEFIKNLSALMNLEINMEIRESEDIYNIQLLSENNPILIGKDGRTINAIQLLLRQHINHASPFNIKINVDASNYKDRKMKNLEREIHHIAKEVLASKIEVKLDPMNSYERRLVHNIIGEYEELSTLSHGEGANRHIVISYQER